MKINKMQIGNYGLLYLTLVLLAVILVVILVVKPRLEKHTGWIGIEVKPDPLTGALVIERVVPGSPAEAVGMLAGDKVLSYDGFAVSDIATLKELIDDSYINQLVRIYIERNGRRLVADTRVAKRPHDLRILPPTIMIPQGAIPPHKNRGLCVSCHTIRPR